VCSEGADGGSEATRASIATPQFALRTHAYPQPTPYPRLAHVWSELYRGWSITIIREVPFTVIQFPLWEALKRYRTSRTGRAQVSGLEGGLLGSVAGAVAAGVTTPLDVLKTRMMLAREKQPMFTMLATIMRESGPRAFFAGMGPRVGWISVGGAIFLGSYQWASNALGGVEES
jgi:solute carrier family 25 S-adenosylmethionine transporter 26